MAGEDMGLGAGYGSLGAIQGLQQLLAQRQAARLFAAQQAQQEFENQRQLTGDQRAQQQLELQMKLRQDALLEAQRQHDLQSQDRLLTRATAVDESTPAGPVSPNSSAVPLLKSVGAIENQPSLPSTQSIGFLKTGANVPGGGVVTTASAPSQYVKRATAKQEQAAATEQAKADELSRQHARDAETLRHDRAMETKQGQVGLITVQTVDENGQPVTKIVPKQAGATFPKGPSAVTQNRLDSAQAVKQTGDDIIAKLSDPKIAASVGPVLGRYNTLRDFIGNPPPELAELAGQIESFALANMGVHGMRSTQGAEQIKALLDRRHTPESLINTVRGLNSFSEHFLQNAGRKSPTGQSTSPSAADLIKKYGGYGG